MATDWDYTDLAPSYGKRPGYAPAAVAALLDAAGAGPGTTACDVGAGTGHLTILLLARGLRVLAVEPNDAMLALGEARTRGGAGVTWHRARGEATGLAPRCCDLVTYGSSFNVVDRGRALRETARILRPGGWLACLWNHRDLSDPLQRAIQEVIHAEVPGYAHGIRRQDQHATIAASGLFGDVRHRAYREEHRLERDEWLEAWRSHATLRRQAGARWPQVVDGIAGLVRARAGTDLVVPYTTALWMARLAGPAAARAGGE
jgi:ubiquinone/menaquinone biosynthesis C-methylase UbiE